MDESFCMWMKEPTDGGQGNHATVLMLELHEDLGLFAGVWYYS